MPPGSRLSIALLGPPVVLVDGAPLRVDTRKALALLAYLSVTGRPARRDTLCALLWRDAAPDRARATLRRTLSSLRSALGGRWLETDGDAVSLDGALRSREIEVPAGSLIVRTNQPLGRLVFYLLEPESDDGLTTWNFFDDALKIGLHPVLKSLP